ncbi:hypothetical protein [Methylomonas sp. CM2]|uniref:hypothetical protein n=1 Tax=Methylomonas sp. CM2 TaxID=3417647 RepID=UPI003CF759E2
MKIIYQYIVLIYMLGFLSLVTGCAKDDITIKHDYMPHKEKSYTIRGHNYSFAVYNGEHNLLTHPIEDLLSEMKYRKNAIKDDITDIYVVSHGWNYTLPVAIANYHNYMERVDTFMSKQTDKKYFQPYFIFITWTSTTRPTSDLTKAVLPFGIDTAIEPLTQTIDKVPLHILTAWKQSLNAAHNALGAHNPNYYLLKDWSETPYGYLGTNPIVDDDATMGEDLPVSGLIYKLIQQKLRPKKECVVADPLSAEDDACVPLTNTKIHLVGHSYGAKLVALSGMEALRRWMLNGIVDSYSNADIRDDNCLKKDYIVDGNLTDKGKASYLECLSTSLETGHLPPFGELLLFFQKNKQTLLADWGKKQQNQSLIDSLVLFNPAFSPGELSYPVEGLTTAPAYTLRFIPRKAIVYSNSDYANGALYGIRDTILNGQLSQYYQSIGNEISTLFDNEMLTPIGRYGPKQLVQASSGAGSLGYASALSLVGYAVSSVINIPFDFIHHVKTGKLDGWTDDSTDPIFKGFFNGMDYFLPIKLTRAFGNPSQGFSLNSPLVFQRDEAQQGLFRLNRPGLGKTGLNHLTEGRIEALNLWGLADYNDDNKTAININADKFCQLSSAPLNLITDTSPDKLISYKDKFYSFDASKVYDSTMPPVGAHSDLRDVVFPNEGNCWNEPKLEKRDYTFNFLLNFTKSNFLDGI